ncbi:hypothetical protein TTHERM_01063950 (macronuclear) [Tetrahymena thermophila SB210]|uniref:Oxalate/formate antiporter protein n=1 Tax=Tetrahymena thermophila (strain SB210) TaxID=312017 RepID=Q22KV0_TETTS|nr:hypothetical protein TTHERM_01063950 [Tetrahymena thermophila SB210]EAR85928.3 hypothetical protein TTHERM_01063950 [Tetrahymena thermophila SB210]|eukprot:XP_976523.3 hypothetical protein TTHERM_01063950 [Tetrahymena thermophila SB210]
MGSLGVSVLCNAITNYIHNNLIFNEGASYIGSALTKCHNLSNLTLSLQRTQIGDEGILDLGSALQKCSNITFLELFLR